MDAWTRRRGGFQFFTRREVKPGEERNVESSNSFESTISGPVWKKLFRKLYFGVVRAEAYLDQQYTVHCYRTCFRCRFRARRDLLSLLNTQRRGIYLYTSRTETMIRWRRMLEWDSGNSGIEKCNDAYAMVRSVDSGGNFSSFLFLFLCNMQYKWDRCDRILV